MNKLIVFIAMSIVLFGQVTHGMGGACFGAISRAAGFCIFPSVVGDVAFCNDHDFSTERPSLDSLCQRGNICCIPNTPGTTLAARFYCVGGSTGRSGLCVSSVDQAQIELCEGPGFQLEQAIGSTVIFGGSAQLVLCPAVVDLCCIIPGTPIVT